MMRVLGITAEYDPIHIGHVHHLNESRRMSRADFCVAVMSGDFTQRGEPAMLSKWVRAEMAVKSGLDLVIELPFVFACGSAPEFAAGAVKTLDALGCVTDISFGSECGDIEIMREIAYLVTEEPPAYKKLIRENLERGRGFPKSRELAVSGILGEDAAKVMVQPNNILGIEYLAALKNLEAEKRINAFTVRRKGTGHNEIGGDDALEEEAEFPSSSMIRKAVLGGSAASRNAVMRFVPKEAEPVLRSHVEEAAESSLVWPFVRAKILQTDTAGIARIAGVTEGIENRLKRFVRTAADYEAYIDDVRSARFSKAAARRMMMHIMMGMTKDDMAAANPEYIRVLAAGPKGRQLLKTIKKEELTKVPVIINVNKTDLRENSRMLRLDMLASDMYGLAAGLDLYSNSDMVRKPYMLEL